MKRIACFLALIISLDCLATMLPKTPLPPHFPKYPLNGLFRVVESRTEEPLPPLEALLPNGYGDNLFFPGQLVRFVDQGGWGSDRPEWQSNEMTLYPPFNPGLCRHVRFYADCDENKNTPPTVPIVESMVVELDRLKEDLDSEDSRLPLATFGAKKGKYLHIVMYADKSPPFTLYFQDWNTLINRGTYWVGRDEGAYGSAKGREIDHWKPKTVIQILKRVKE